MLHSFSSTRFAARSRPTPVAPAPASSTVVVSQRPLAFQHPQDHFDGSATPAPPSRTSGWLDILLQLPARLERFQMRNDHLNNLTAAIPFAFPRQGLALYEFFWTDFKSAEERGDKLWDARASALFRFTEMLKVALDRGYEGKRMCHASRTLVIAALGDHADATSASSALRSLYRRQHTDKRVGSVWVPEEDQEDFKKAYDALNVIKSILATPFLRDALFIEDSTKPSAAKNQTSFFFKLTVLLARFWASLRHAFLFVFC